MQPAGVENKRSNPVRPKRVLVAYYKAHVIVMRSRARRGKRRLLHHGVVRDVTVGSGAEKPLRTCGLRPVQTGRGQIIPERYRAIAGYSNRIDGADRRSVEAFRVRCCGGLELLLV